MNDLEEILDATVPVPIEFLGAEITLHVFTAGLQRLTKEQRIKFQEINEQKEVADSQVAELEAGLTDDLALDAKFEINSKIRAAKLKVDEVSVARQMLHLLIKGWEKDGEPLTFRQKGFPECIPDLPDSLLMEMASKAVAIWNNPTDGETEGSGSPQVELAAQGENQSADTTQPVS